MKKNINEKLLCPVTLGLGILGLILRLWLDHAGYDDRGLLVTSHPANTLTFVLTALILGFIALCLPKCPNFLKKPLPASKTAAIGCFAAACGILLANIFELTHAQDSMTLICALLGVLAAVGFFYMGQRRKHGHRGSMAAFCVLIAYYMVHLILQYRLWSAAPQLQTYLFPLLASVFLMLFAYHRTALDVHGKGFRQYIFFNQAALFFCCLSLNTNSWMFYLPMAVWVATDLYIPTQHKAKTAKGHMELPQDVTLCMNMLKSAGYSAYAVGGCVRDALLGKTPQDYDLCTNALPQQICQVFGEYQLIRSGEKHGTIGVVINHQVYEITTFRTDGGYSDSRHPDWVSFVDNIEEDLARRDFTVNAMAYSPERGFVDPWGGQQDLQKHILRTVGDAPTRFKEDPLRILRGVRFAVRYAFEPEAKTEDAMYQLAPLMDNLARERVYDELCKLLPLVTARDLIRFAPVIVQVIPELEATLAFNQCNPHHKYDVYTHTAHVVAAVHPTLTLRWAALLHDVAKPQCFTLDEEGVGHFIGHAEQSAQMADDILRRLKAPTALREQVAFLVEAHMLELPPDIKVLRRRVSKFGMEAISHLLQLKKADCAGTGTIAGDDGKILETEALLEQIKQENSCLQVKDLAISGTDLMEAGFAPGPQMGSILNQLLEAVLNEEVPNEATALLEKAKQITGE